MKFLFPIILLILFQGPMVLAQKTKIALSRSGKNYVAWLKHADPNIETLDLYRLSIDSAVIQLRNCHGILFTGGDDIYPAWYSREQDTSLCTSFDRRRDTLEFALLKEATSQKIPILGICRGCQLINVGMGGSLFPDLPSEPGTDTLHQRRDKKDQTHRISIAPETRLASLADSAGYIVNSNHHQAIRGLGSGLRPTAFWMGQIVEAIECDESWPGFLMAVQWHPERMDLNHPLSEKVAHAFLATCMKQKMN